MTLIKTFLLPGLLLGVAAVAYALMIEGNPIPALVGVGAVLVWKLLSRPARK